MTSPSPRPRPGPLRELWLLVRMELLRLARTSEVLRFIVLPALVGLPVLVFAVVMATSMRGPRAVVAIPPSMPPELEIEAALTEDLLAVQVEADPRAAWEAGRVDAAIVDVVPGDGIAMSRDRAQRPAWVVRVVADEAWVARAITASAERAGEDWLADVVALAGGDPERDLWTADVSTVLDDRSLLPFALDRGVAAYASFMLGFVAYLFLALPLVADRADGVTETLRALPISPTRTMLARLLAMGVLQLVVAGLLVANVALLFAPLTRGESIPIPTLPALAAVITSTLCVSAGYGLVGVIAPTIKTASNGATLVMFCHLGLIAWALLDNPPALVPVAGSIAAHDVQGQLLGVAGSLAAAVALAALAGHLLSTRVHLVLPRGGPA